MALPPETRDRLLHHLKTRGPLTAGELARRVDITPTGVRQHLDALRREGLVTAGEAQAEGVGRPARHWRLTEKAAERFPDGHADLALEMLTATREAFGAEGLQRLVDARTEHQVARYREQLPRASEPLAKRVAALTKIRKQEGYMAEWKRLPGGAFELAENHCPICAAAKVCQGICGGELELFRRALGRGVSVERTEHMLDGARRCAYRIA